LTKENKETTNSKLKPYGVTYQKKRIMVPCETNPRTGKCDGCGRERGKEIKTTQLHHWIYQFETKTVKKNPQLALKNTNEFCFYPCHKTADALRSLCEINPRYHEIMVKIAKLMPKYMQDRFTSLCKLWLKHNGRVVNK
jgi:hypothetical protein